MASGHPPRFRRFGPQRRCSQCHYPVAETLAFCPNCAVSLAEHPPEIVANTKLQDHVVIPDYLLKASPQRYQEPESTGTGFVLMGLCLVLIPVVIGNLSPPAVLSMAAGFILTVTGIARARTDHESLLKAGAMMAAVAIVVLGVLGYQITQQQNLTDENAAIMSPTEAVTESASAVDLASNSENLASSTMPVARGSVNHLGIMPGKDLAGNPYRLWRYDTGRDLKSAPVVSDGVAYVGTHDGFLVAVDLQTGVPSWRFDLGGYPVSGSPALANRTIYIGSGYYLYAIDQKRGTERWRYEMSYAGESSAVVDGGTVYIASKENYVYAVSADTGEKEWTFKTEGLLFGSPAVSDDMIVIADDIGTVYGIGRETGHAIWRFPSRYTDTEAPGAVFSTPVIGDGIVVVTYQSRTSYVLDLKTGEPIWSYPIGGSTSPALDHGIIYVGSDDGAVYAFDYQHQSDPLWLFSTGDGQVSSPIILGNTLYAASGPTLFALDRETGKQRWHYPIGDQVTTDIVAADGTIYIGTRDGNLYAITGDESTATPVTG